MTDEIPEDFKQLYASITLPTTTDDEFQVALKAYRHCEGKIAELRAEVERLKDRNKQHEQRRVELARELCKARTERDNLQSWQVLAVEALTTATNVLDSDDPAIVDTVWVPDQPETLHDLCISVLEQVTPAPPEDRLNEAAEQLIDRLQVTAALGGDKQDEIDAVATVGHEPQEGFHNCTFENNPDIGFVVKSQPPNDHRSVVNPDGAAADSTGRNDVRNNGGSIPPRPSPPPGGDQT